MKITIPTIALAFLVGLFTSIGWWLWTVIHTFAVPEPWLGILWHGLRHTFSDPNLRPIAFLSLLKGFVPVIVLLWAINEADDGASHARFIRGARLATAKELMRKTRTNSGGPQIKVAGVPMPLACEPGHLLLAGSSNTGKTTAADEVLHFAHSRGDRTIVIDPNGHALARFSKNGDIVLNPFDQRSPGWSIFNELRTDYDVERFSKSVVPDSSDSSSQQWHG